jgi:hypothetical protein
MPLVRLTFNPNEADEQRFEIAAHCVTVGTAADNDVCLDLPGLSAHHFKLERREQAWHCVDLHSKQGTFINAQRISDCVVARGTVLHAGEICFLFDVVEQDAAAAKETVCMPVISGTRTDIAVVGAGICWRCHQSLAPGTVFCPACGADQRGAYTPSTYVAPMETPQAPGAGLLPLVALILSVLGPLLFGLGWLAGIVLGFIAISILRRRGGHAVDARRAHLAVYVGFGWMVVLGLLIGWWFYASETTRRIRRNEIAVISQLREVALAQTYARLSLTFDRDGNLVGEFASLAELVSNGYGHVEPTLATQPDWSGYRFSMPSADEAEFTCLAEPAQAGFSGRRAFLIRSDGYVHEATPRGDAPLNPAADFRRLDARNIIDEHADVLVRDLQRVAAEALRSSLFEKAQRIVRAARERFPTARETAQLDAIDQHANPFVVEIKSMELLEQASNACAQGQVLREIELLQTLREQYPTCKSIHDVDARLRQRRDAYGQALERAAQTMLDNAIALDIRLQFDNAAAMFNTVINQYPTTAAAKEAQRRLALLADHKTDRAADALIQETFALSLDTAAEAIAARIDQLLRAFAHIAVVSQSTARLQRLQEQAIARIHLAQAGVAMVSNDLARALVCFRETDTRDPAALAPVASNFARALLFGVSNALVAADFPMALVYADRYQELRIAPDALPLVQIDTIRLRMAEQCAQQGDTARAMQHIADLGERVHAAPAASFLAGKVYRAGGDYANAALCFQRVVTQAAYAAEARALLLESAANAAAADERTLYAAIAADLEWATATRALALAIPGVTNAYATSTWQAVCIDLADLVDMSYDLLTYSGAEADFFVEKQKAQDELNAALRRLQKMLRDSMRSQREAGRAARAVCQWWTLCSAVISNAPAAALSDDARAQAALVARKQYFAAAAAGLLERAVSADTTMKSGVLAELRALINQLQQRRPLRNILATMKKYIADQRPAEYGRKALNAVNELHGVQVDPLRLGDVFSHVTQ